MALAAVLAWPAVAAAQMPDARQMSGIARPDPQLAAGVVTVRVIRGSFDNPVVSLTVDLAGPSLKATTDGAGRAEFTGVAAGTRAKAVAVVAGERLESEEFTMPASGGIRLALVASDPSGGPAAAPPAPGSAPAPTLAPAQPGTVVLGPETRFVFESGEDGLTVFYVLQIVNAATAPVQPPTPVIFELPLLARGATVLQGSSPQATVSGRQLSIAGPFAPGNTLVQVAYTAPFDDAQLVIEQPMPLDLRHVAVVAQKLGDMQLSSPQIPEQQTMPANGNLYIAGRGGAVAAGTVMRFAFSGMPHAPTWPRNVAVGLALLILGAGAVWSFRPVSPSVDAQRAGLEERRDRLFDELAALEDRQRQADADPGDYAARRRELVAALEGVYAALDDEIAVGRAS